MHQLYIFKGSDRQLRQGTPVCLIDSQGALDWIGADGSIAWLCRLLEDRHICPATFSHLRSARGDEGFGRRS